LLFVFISCGPGTKFCYAATVCIKLDSIYAIFRNNMQLSPNL